MAVIHIEGVDGDYEVWIDTEGSRCDGTVIGVGATKDDAIESAVHELSARIGELKGMRTLAEVQGQ